MARLTPETERFLREAVAGLPSRKRSEAKDELRAHLEDAIAERVEKGDPNASAERNAKGTFVDVVDLDTARGRLRALEDAIRERRVQDATPTHDEHEVAADLTSPNHGRIRDEIRALEGLRLGLEQRIARFQAERRAVATLGHAAALNRELLRVHFGRKWPLHYFRERLVRRLMQLLRGPFNLMVRVERGRFERLISQCRYDEAIALAKREIASRGPSFLTLDRLAAAYSASGDHERALTQRQAAVDWLKSHKLPWRFIQGHNATLGIAYCNLAGALKRLQRDDEAEAAVRAGLAVDDENFMLNLLQAEYCLKHGDYDGAFHHLEVSLDEERMVFDVGKNLLMILHGSDFDPVRQDARFGRIVQRAYEWA